MYLGTYETQHDAAKVYDKAAQQYHGKKAILNFDDSGEAISAHQVNRTGVRHYIPNRDNRDGMWLYVSSVELGCVAVYAPVS